MDENKNKINDSTTSETFDTWTLVTENSSSSASSSSNNLNDNDIKRVEILNKDDDSLNLKIPEVNIEELSDGISVISESESIEECNEKYPLHDHLFTNRVIEEPHLQETILNRRENYDRKIISTKNETNNQIVTDFSQCFCVKNIVSGIFYIGAIAGILGFIGQLKGLNNGTSTTEINLMEERISNLELQNNLLRAEINILEKKLNYLTNSQQQHNNQYNKPYNKEQRQTTQHHESKLNEKNNNYDKEKYNVNNINHKPDITSGCEDNEIFKDGVCVIIENNNGHKKKENVPKYFENKSQDQKQPNNLKDMKSNNNQHQNENVYHKYKKENNEKSYESHDHKSFEKNVDNFSAESNEDDDDDDDDDDHLEFHKKQSYEKHDKKDDYKKSKKYDDNNKKDYRYSKEFNKHDNSKEFNKYDNSKEFNKYDKSKEYNKYEKKNNDWHNNLMESRENYRKQNSKEKKDNWLVERGHGREEFRIFENDVYKKKFRSH